MAPAVVATQHNDTARTGAILTETVLDTSNVNPGQFGLLFRRQVDGEIYAQPLYVPNADFGRAGVHNVVYVATMHNTVFAFDADDPAASQPLWVSPFGSSIPLPDGEIGPGGFLGIGAYHDIAVEVGIVSTPVVSPDHNVLYTVSTSKVGNAYSHSLHALDLRTGTESLGGPVVIKGSINGTGDGSQNGLITFDSRRQIQRAGLLLIRDAVYVAFASYGDRDPYHGWIFAYSTADLTQKAIFNATPNGKQGGIWQAGQGLAADNTAIYFMTGNGSFDMFVNDKPNPAGRNLGDCFVKLNLDLTLADWFSPHNNQQLNSGDLDLGSAGPLLIPNTQLLVGGGKEGKLYLINRANMGHYNPNNDGQIVQPPFQATDASQNPHHLHGGPVYWEGPVDRLLYVWGENSFLTAFRMVDGTFDTRPVQQSSTTGGGPGMPGGFLTLTANGQTKGSAIVWATHNFDRDANHCVVDGILHAFDAEDLGCEQWSSKMIPSRDELGLFAKFCPPTVANGKVYVATFSNYLAVYGALANRSPLVGDLCKKLVLSETTIGAPALGNLNDALLALGWTGTDSQHHVNVELFDNQFNFRGKVTLGETSGHGPSLAFGGGRLFLAWTGTDSRHRLNVLSSADGQTFVNKVTLQDTSPWGPAVAYGNGTLYLAWAGSDWQHSLNVISSVDGVNFANKVTLSDTSSASPCLCYIGTKLYLLWRGNDWDHRLNVMESTDGQHFTNKRVLKDSSDHHPSLARLGGILYLLWTGRDSQHRLNALTSTTDTSGFGDKLTYHDTSAAAPALVGFGQQLFLAWTGTDGSHHLNLVRVA